MSESKGWVHWHPYGYGLTDDGALSHIPSEWYLWYSAEIATVAAEDAAEGSREKECEVITYEEAARRLVQAVMKATAEKLRQEREAAPKPIANLNMAPKACIAKTTEARMMVYFRIDPSKYRVGVRKVGDVYNVNVTDREDGSTIYCRTGAIPNNEALFGAIAYSVAGNADKLMPHPWKRADGSHIKANWEE